MTETSIQFAIKALEWLDSDNPELALVLCLKGVEEFPDYPAGILMLSESFFDCDDFSSAKETIESALKRFPKYLPFSVFEQKLNSTLSLIETGKEMFDEEIEPEISEEQPVQKSDVQIKDEETDDVKVTAISPEPVAETSETNQTKPEAENFLRLVSRLDSETSYEQSLRADNPMLIPGLTFTPLRATRKTGSDSFSRQSVLFPDFYNPYDTTNSEQNPQDNPVNSQMNNYASDTIAGILESQGAYHQAIEVYNQLSERHPELKEYYDSKIDSILKKIRD